MPSPATAAVRLLTGEREPVRLATTGPIDVDTGGLLTIDGVLTEVGDRVLVKNQTDGSENGIRTASEGQWFRAADSRTSRTMQKGTTVHVQEGTANASKSFVFSTLDVVVGDTNIVIVDWLFGLDDITDATGVGFVIDEDDMVSDSATKVPTQQSVKAYADTKAGEPDNNIFTGQNKFADTADATGQPPFQIIKSATPLNYDAAAYNSPDIVVQWSDSTALGSGVSRDSHLFRSDITGDGVVAITPSTESGGTSFSVWRGLTSTANKTGDGSAHNFTAIGELRAVGPTGYNELGLFVGTGTNTGSWLGTVHGSELLVRDGTGVAQNSGTAQAGGASSITLSAGASAVDDTYNNYAIRITGGTGSGQFRRITDYVGATKVATVGTAWGVQPDATSTYSVILAHDSSIIGHIARTARYYGGTRQAVSFLASSEGTIESTAILKTSVGGLRTWNLGIDFEDVVFSSGIAVKLEEGHRIRWTDGANNSTIHADASGHIIIDPAGQTLLNDSGTVSLPALAWVGDQDTGIFRNAADDLQITAGGVARIRALPNNLQLALGAGALKTVTEGADNSGGLGFRWLVVPN